MTPEKIGILGGTFDPIHNAHLILAEEARSFLSLDTVILMPSGHSYMKDDRAKKVTDAKDRLSMTRIAALGEAHLSVSDMEVLREGNTYTADTLTALKEMNPDAVYYYIVGADTLCHMDSWYKPEIVFQLAEICVAVREDQVDENELLTAIEHLQNKYGARIHRLPILPIGISSTLIRERVARGESIHFLTPAGVEDYILEKGLYRDELPDRSNLPTGLINAKTSVSKENRLEIIRKTEELLPYKRFVHSCGVAQTAYMLSLIHGADADRAELAGYLHDVGKYLSKEDKIRLCEENGLPVSEIESENDELLHAKASSVMAKQLFGVEDEEILSAIRCHSTGKPGMTLLEKILFIADYTEPGRNLAKRLPEIRKTMLGDLDRALLMILEDTLRYLEYKEVPIDPTTKETYRYYLDVVQ